MVKLDPDTRRVYVGPKDALETRTVPLKEINWLGDGDFWKDAPADGWEARVKVRSTRPPTPARIRPLPDGRAEVELIAAERGVAPGQACVFYAPEGTRVLGGGWITKS